MKDGRVLELFGSRQQDLLKLLLLSKEGLSMDDLAASLAITRTAVRQHLSSLEAAGFVREGGSRKTAGRPGRTYLLTDRGSELFPRQYSWFSGILLQALKDERGSEGLAAWLRDLADVVAQSLAPRMAGKVGQERVTEIVRIMDELAAEAKAIEAAGDDAGTIEASNCVYHVLARQHPEVCQFDIALISRLMGTEAHHTACMVRGGAACRFKLGR